jgi:hypothetical protein
MKETLRVFFFGFLLPVVAGITAGILAMHIGYKLL